MYQVFLLLLLRDFGGNCNECTHTFKAFVTTLEVADIRCM